MQCRSLFSASKRMPFRGRLLSSSASPDPYNPGTFFEHRPTLLREEPLEKLYRWFSDDTFSDDTFPCCTVCLFVHFCTLQTCSLPLFQCLSGLASLNRLTRLLSFFPHECLLLSQVDRWERVSLDEIFGGGYGEGDEIQC